MARSWAIGTARTIRATPLAKARSANASTPAGVVRVALVFDTENKDLKQWTLTQPSGAELTFSLYDVDKDVEIPKSYFSIDASYKSVSAPKE